MIEKTLVTNLKNRKGFNVFDSAIATIAFVVLQFGFIFVYSLVPARVRSIDAIGYIASIGVECTFLIASYVTAKFRNVDFVSATKIKKKINWPIVGFCLLLAFVTIVSFSSLTNIFLYILESAGYTYTGSDIVINDFFTYIIYLIVSCAIPAITEEILFRGTICAGLEKSNNKHLAVWVSALVFMLMHGSPNQTVHQFILGVIFGYIFVYTGNLWITILIHFFNNAIAVSITYFSSLTASATSSSAGVEPMGALALAFNIIYGLAMAAVGVMIVIAIIKAIKKQLDKIKLKGKKEQVHSDVLASESETIKVDDEDVVVVDSQDIIAKQNNEETKKEMIGTIICYTLAGAILIFEWVASLISGFIV